MCGRAAITAGHGDRLRALVGRTLTRAWLLWDVADDTWFADGPVLLDFGGEQAEIQHRKFDDLAVSWNSLAPRGSAHWPGFDLRRRHDAVPAPASLQGRVLRDVELLEWRGDDAARGMVAIGFVFPHGRVTVFNALDENGLGFTAPEPSYEHHSLGQPAPAAMTEREEGAA
ncbi:hypothetical protein ADL06_25825 [Streptomyces sp. NRRL F-6491]|nr:hypothetical protein ADL06_25825 [Streptomyces sp. NRRL F-6491]KOX40317.1 hypothetical protein ADL08_22610 [Streptomyces sp. NRRL F-6492]